MAMLFRRNQLEALATMFHAAYATAPDNLVAGILHVQRVMSAQLKTDNPRFDGARFVAAIRRER